MMATALAAWVLSSAPSRAGMDEGIKAYNAKDY
jgi:hypothetical protein